MNQRIPEKHRPALVSALAHLDTSIAAIDAENVNVALYELGRFMMSTRPLVDDDPIGFRWLLDLIRVGLEQELRETAEREEI